MRKDWLALAVLLGGCVTHSTIRPLRPLEIATAPYREVTSTALTGSLMYEGGCLLFHDERTHALLLPVLPMGSVFNGSAALVHHPGKTDQWVTIGQEIMIYGEPLRWDSFATSQYQPFHHQCGLYAPFFVSAVRPSD